MEGNAVDPQETNSLNESIANVQVQPGKQGNSPLEAAVLQGTLETALTSAVAQGDASAATVSEQLKRAALEALGHNSSQYKYIVSVTWLVTGTGSTVNNDFKLGNDVGALWSAKKDGLLNFSLQDSASGTRYLVTVFYVFK